MAAKAKKNDIAKLSFEDSIKGLKTIVDKIEQGEIALQDSLQQYEQGMALIQHCRDILQKAEKRIEKFSKPQEAETETTEEDEGAEEIDEDADDAGLF